MACLKCGGVQASRILLAGPNYLECLNSSCAHREPIVAPVPSPSCGGTMTAMASIVDDHEVGRVLAHLGMPAEFPKTKPSRAPPGMMFDEDGQLDPGVDGWDGKDEMPQD